jgi:hypothetical protein
MQLKLTCIQYVALVQHMTRLKRDFLPLVVQLAAALKCFLARRARVNVKPSRRNTPLK